MVGRLRKPVIASPGGYTPRFGQTALFYLLVYALMNLGAFGVAMLLALFHVSLAGIPPTAGFIGKFYLFGAVVKNGFVGLAVLGVLNSAVSIYYYLRPVVYGYMLPAQGEVPVPCV